MSFRNVSVLAKQSVDFETRIKRVALSLAHEQKADLVAGDAEGQSNAHKEEVGLSNLQTALTEVRSGLTTAFYLADVRDYMRDRRDNAAVFDSIKKVAPSGFDATKWAISAAADVLSSTNRPGIAEEVSKVADFLPHARDAFQACVDQGAAAK